MELVPNELWTEVAVYLDFKDLDTLQLVIGDVINWFQLMSTNFPQFIRNDLVNYNIKYIYYDLIINRGTVTRFLFEDTEEYMICNNLVHSYDINWDNVKIYKKVLGNKNPNFEHLIQSNFLKIIGYILKEGILEREWICDIMAGTYEEAISLEMTKLLFKDVNLDDAFIGMTIYLMNKTNRDSFDYLLSIAPEPQDPVRFAKGFIEIVGDCGGAFYNFSKFWAKYSTYLNPDDVLEAIDKYVKMMLSISELSSSISAEIDNITIFLNEYKRKLDSYSI